MTVNNALKRLCGNIAAGRFNWRKYIVFETSKTTGMKQDENYHNFRITHTVRLVTMLMGCILNHIFFLLDSKFLAKIV